VQNNVLYLKDKKMVLNSDTFLIFQEGVFILRKPQISQITQIWDV